MKDYYEILKTWISPFHQFINTDIDAPNLIFQGYPVTTNRDIKGTIWDDNAKPNGAVQVIVGLEIEFPSVQEARKLLVETFSESKYNLPNPNHQKFLNNVLENIKKHEGSK